MAVVLACLVFGFSLQTRSMAETLGEAWQRRAKVIDGQLQAGKWRKGRRACRQMLEEMRDNIASGEGAGVLLGAALTYLAVAEAGEGAVDEALWHWQVAKQLFPEVAEFDLSRFGEPAAVLARGQAMLNRGEAVDSPEPQRVTGEVSPPKKLKTSPLNYPLIKRFPPGEDSRVIVQCIIGTDGRPREPRILSYPEDSLTFVVSALESLREWRFEPARLHGKPVAVYYNLVVDFQLR